jgi:hypothetical protein
MTAKHWREYGLGMTGNLFYLQRPFAVISCLVGDEALADDIEAGHIEQVSSCRQFKGFRDSRNGQTYQGPWTANHLAFVDKRSGRVGRSPGAWVLTKGELPRISNGRISVDSVPGLTYDIPDYDSFTLKSIHNGVSIYEPAEEPEIAADSIMASRRIIVPTHYLIAVDDTEDTHMPLTPEELKDIATTVSAALTPTLEALGTKITEAVRPVAADDTPEPSISVADSEAAVEAARKQAELDGRRKGKLLAVTDSIIASDSAMSAALAPLSTATTIGEIAKGILSAIVPDYKAGDETDDEAYGMANVHASTYLAQKAKPLPATPGKNFSGKPVPTPATPVADDTDPNTPSKASPQMGAQRKAFLAGAKTK